MKIGNYDLKEKIMVIAEIGNNHEGDFTLAEELIGLAAQSGVDAVKFQTIIPEHLVSIQEKERIKQLTKFQLTYDQFRKLANLAENEGIIFLSTPFDINSAIFLKNIVPAFKISSGDNNFFPLIQTIAETGKPIIMSTGLANFNQVKKSSDFIKSIWKNKEIEQELALLHCVSLYPTPHNQANLFAIRELEKLADIVGYSDHTIGTEAAMLSVAMGARIIEKHFTIDNNYSEFRDHQLSLDPDGMKRLVEGIKLANSFLGTGLIELGEDEKKSIAGSRRSIVAKRNLAAGSEIKIKDIDWVRPALGVFPGNENLILGKKLKKDLNIGELITLEALM